jgi:hypothetical protein
LRPLPYPLTVSRLVWDEWNIDHIARHRLTVKQVEEVISGPYRIAEGHSDRWIILGRTGKWRSTFVVIEVYLYEEGKYYVRTAYYPDARQIRKYFGK